MSDKIYIFRQGDYKKIGDFLWKKNSMACEDCLLGMYVWKDRYDLKLYHTSDSSFIYSQADDTFLMPVPGLTREALGKMKSISERPVIVRVTEQGKDCISENFRDLFTFSEDTGSFDYIYDIENMAYLRGKKLAKKRNHVNGFLNTYEDWHTEEISGRNLFRCRDFLKLWYADRLENSSAAGIESLLAEKNSLFNVLENFDGVMADGIVLYVGGKVCGLTIGQRISEHTYDVVFEKADECVKGAYNMINREFARYVMEKYSSVRYLNRENDLNIEGLRRAKNSYRPVQLLKKYTAEYTG
ncbi:MAG: DUF2156 domain-containing protein [Porcipelethomonas sp.]